MKILKNNFSRFILKETAKLILTPHHGKVILDIYVFAAMFEGSIYYGDKLNYYDSYHKMTQDQAWSLFKL